LATLAAVASRISSSGTPEADLDRVALVDEDFAERAGGRGLEGLLDLLRLDLGERLVLGDAVADGPTNPSTSSSGR
jgi:hypothetical protein